MRTALLRLLLYVVLLLAGPALSREVVTSAPVLPAKGSVQVAFAPWDDAESLVIETIASARVQILVQAYLLTSHKIADSLIKARQRGVDVRVLADARQHEDNPASMLDWLVQNEIPVWLETRYRNAHNKILLIDAGTTKPVVVSGSYNFTWSAQNMNAENLLLIKEHPELARRYEINWQRHLQTATPYFSPEKK